MYSSALFDAVILGALQEIEASDAARVGDESNGWRSWLQSLFPEYVRAGFAPRHEEFWDWAWSIEPEVRPRPFVAVWPRGGGKSTTSEAINAMLGLRGKRKYGLYVCSSQDQADKHVANIAAMLERAGAERALNKYGSSKGWRRNRLRTASGFTIDALGLDVAARGAKVDEWRPDVITFDDVDGRTDSRHVTNGKEISITENILPSGGKGCAVMFAQNLIIQDGIVSRIVKGVADYLIDAIVSGPHKALEKFRYWREGERWKVSGEPTWAGQSLADCEDLVNDIGPRSFRRESQHEVGDREGALWRREPVYDETGRLTAHGISSTRVNAPPRMHRMAVAVDPASTSKNTSDECGIIGGGLGVDGHGYVYGDATLRGTPDEWGRAASALCHRIGARKVYVEGNNGGEMAKFVINTIDPTLDVEIVWASTSKEARAEPVSLLYSEGRMHHVGELAELEDEQCGWVPKEGKSPNRIDALAWLAHGLGLTKNRTIKSGANPLSNYRG